MTAPGDGFRVGKGYVEVEARVSDTSARAAGEKITEEVDDQVKKDAPGIGDGLGEGITKGTEDGVKKRRPRIKKVGDQIGADVKTAITDNLQDGQPVFKSLSKGLDDIRARAKALRAEFAQTGSTSVFGDLKKTEADAKRLENIIKTAFGEPLQNASQGGEELRETLLKIAPALAPFVAPVAAGSLLAVLGGGGLALGIVGQLDSPIVQGALAKLKGDVSGALDDATQDYDTELSEALHALDDGVTGFLGELKPGLQAIRPELTGLAKDVSQGLKDSGSSFSSALAKSKPVIDAVGDSIEGLIKDTGTAFDNMSDGADGAGQAIRDLTGNIGDLEIAAGDALGALSQLYGAISEGTDAIDAKIAGSGGVWTDVWNNIKTGVGDAINPIHGAIDSVKGLHDEFDKSTDSGNKAADANKNLGSTVQNTTGSIRDQTSAVADWAAAFNEINDQAQSLELATLDAKDAIAQLTQQVKLNGTSLSDNTQKGRDNIRAIIDKINAGKDLAEQVYKETGSTQKATDAYNDYIKQLEAAAKKAGFNKTQVAELVAEYGKIPSNINTTITTTYKVKGVPPPQSGGGVHTPGAERSGGIRRAASGLVSGFFPEGAGPLTVFDEPGTGGEARIVGPGGVGYVPMTGRPDNNLGIISTLAGMYGRALTGARPNDGAAAQIVNRYEIGAIQLNGPWNALDPDMPRQVVARIHDELARYEKSVR